MKSNNYEHYQKQKGRSKNSRAVNGRMLSIFKQWLRKEKLDEEQVQYTDLLSYILHLKRKNIKQSTIKGYLNAVRIYYDYLNETEAVAHHPIRKVELKGADNGTLHHILKPEQLNKLYHGIPNTNPKEKRNKAVSGIIIYQGAATHELTKIKTEHIDFEKGTIYLPEGRRNNERKLQLHPSQMMHLYEYTNHIRAEILKRRKIETDQLLINLKKGNSLATATEEITVHFKVMNPNIKNLKQIRASVIVKWIKSENLRKAQYFAGHRYISSTENYLQNEVEGLKEEVNRYHPLQ